MQRFSTRLVGAMILIFIASFFGAAFLNFVKFEQTYVELAQERYDSVAQELRRTIESTLGIGLSLDASQSVQGVIDRVVEQYDEAFGVIVVDTAINPLFESQAVSSVALQNLDAMSNVMAHVGTTHELPSLEHLRFEDRFLTLAPIDNLFGEREGYVLLEHDASTLQQTIDRLSQLLWSGVTFLSVIFVVVIAGTVFLVMHPAERRFRAAALDLRALLTEEAGLEIETPTSGLGVDEAGALISELKTAEKYFTPDKADTP